MANKINDFGNKIGGARKDFFRSDYDLNEIDGWSYEDKHKLICKNKILPAINYQELLDEGMDKAVIYFKKKLRDSLLGKPFSYSKDSIEEYNQYLIYFNDAINEIAVPEDISSFFDKCFMNIGTVNGRYFYADRFVNLINNKLLKVASTSSYQGLKAEAKKKRFLSSEDEIIKDEARERFSIQSAKNLNLISADDKYKYSLNYFTSTIYLYANERLDYAGSDSFFIYKSHGHEIVAGGFVDFKSADEYMMDLFMKTYHNIKNNEHEKRQSDSPEYLSHVRDRIGCSNRYGSEHVRVIEGKNDIQSTFNFYGVEFGNWLNNKERQIVVDWTYDSFCDLARALNISVKELTFNGTLSLAGGARGRGGAGAALAHYEPGYKVINLTKMRGAGALAHEYGHALDHYLGELFCRLNNRSLSIKSLDNFASSHSILSSDFEKLYQCLLFKDAVETISYDDYLKKARNDIDGLFKWIDYFIKKDMRTSEVDAKINAIVQDIIDNPFPFVSGQTSPHIEELSAIKKELTGKVIDRSDRMNMSLFENSIHCIMKDAPPKGEIRNRNVKVKTIFYDDAGILDNCFHHSKAYYTIPTELFARAFACYVKDKLEDMGIVNDYLTGLADSGTYHLKNVDRPVCAFPHGEERKAFNSAFDVFFDSLRSRSIFREFRDNEIGMLTNSAQSHIWNDDVPNFDTYEQLSLFDCFDNEI